MFCSKCYLHSFHDDQSQNPHSNTRLVDIAKVYVVTKLMFPRNNPRNVSKPEAWVFISNPKAAPKQPSRVLLHKFVLCTLLWRTSSFPGRCCILHLCSAARFFQDILFWVCIDHIRVCTDRDSTSVPLRLYAYFWAISTKKSPEWRTGCLEAWNLAAAYLYCSIWRVQVVR